MAHAFIKRAELPPIRLVEANLIGHHSTTKTTSHAKAVLIDAWNKWNDLWAPSSTSNKIDWGNAEFGKTDPPRHGELRGIARSFKLRTTKVDGWHPRQFAALSDGALDALGYLFALYENTGHWYNEQTDLLVCLIPKPDGDRRPILHFRSTFRLWSRWAQKRVRKWATTAIPDASLNNGKGRAPGDMAWRYTVRGDLKTDKGGHVSELMWDISKAFDRVPRHILVRRALDLGYPAAVLRLSMASYAWRRRLVDGSLVSKSMFPTSGVGPGSAFATFELAALLVSDLRQMERAHPYATLSLHVDDLIPQVYGDTPDELVNNTMDIVRDAVQRFEVTLGMMFDPKKHN